jgi:hypothetical protein
MIKVRVLAGIPGSVGAAELPAPQLAKKHVDVTTVSNTKRDTLVFMVLSS